MLEMTTLLSIIMFSQLIMGIVPESSLAVPKIGKTQRDERKTTRSLDIIGLN